MRTAITSGDPPNFLLLRYLTDPLKVTSLFFVPDFAITLSVLERRAPLGPNARRAGWIGCNILLNHLPIDARIYLVRDAKPVPPDEARRAFCRLKPLAAIKAEQRGWTLDVLNAVRSLNKSHFELAEVYAFETALRKLHPNNAHVRDKIRQQLQVLRDHGFLKFLGTGSYSFT